MPSPALISARPPIIISETDADRLYLLAERAADRAAGLLEELERARVSPDRRVPADVIGMNSTVDFIDEARGAVGGGSPRCGAGRRPLCWRLSRHSLDSAFCSAVFLDANPPPRPRLPPAGG